MEQKFETNRAVLEGFQLAFEGPLEEKSTKMLRSVLKSKLGVADGGTGSRGKDRDPPGRCPTRGTSDPSPSDFVLLKPFWVKAGPLAPEDWSKESSLGSQRFILTNSVTAHLRRLSRAVAAGPWPVLLEGPTSAGKTTLVEYLGARCGHKVIRINNHEHTDIQEYTGAYAANSSGSLSFQDGLLVQALRRGHWVILDELNLAPSEVLEALNRLLDDNRELYLPEVNEVVKPHPNFRLFATQNPSGAYGGRKPLSRAFRNRFIEIHLGDIPTKDLVMILEKRCQCPVSHAKLLVQTMTSLRQRRSKSGVFLGKDGLITARDLLRWAGRKPSSKGELALEGYMLLAERLRSLDEQTIVRQEIEKSFKVKLDTESVYFGAESESRKALKTVASYDSASSLSSPSPSHSSVVPTRAMLRSLTLVLRAMRAKEPVLLVGGESISALPNNSIFR